MEYGYARASTNADRQDIGRQKRELMAMGVKEYNIFWEYESGSHEDRAKLHQLLETVKAGDTVACIEVSRLSRSTKQLCEILEFAEKNRIKLVVGSFMVDCTQDDICCWKSCVSDGMAFLSYIKYLMCVYYAD